MCVTEQNRVTGGLDCGKFECTGSGLRGSIVHGFIVVVVVCTRFYRDASKTALLGRRVFLTRLFSEQ